MISLWNYQSQYLIQSRTAGAPSLCLNMAAEAWEDELATSEPDLEKEKSKEEAGSSATTQVKAKAKAKVKAKAKSKAAADGKSADVRICPCPSCDEPIKKKVLYCESHQRCFQNMEYQRSTQEDEEAAAAYDAAMANPTTAAEEVQIFGENNPGDQKYKRKTLLEWGRFIKKYGHRVEM